MSILSFPFLNRFARQLAGDEGVIHAPAVPCSGQIHFQRQRGGVTHPQIVPRGQLLVGVRFGFVQRRVLMGHLNGYAAFRNEAGMRAHRDKYAQLRREQQEAKEGAET